MDVKSQDLNDSPAKNWLDFWSQKADAKLNGLKSAPNLVSLIHVLPVDFDYGPDADGKNFLSTFLANTKGAMADHYALASYLDHMFRQDNPPKRTVGISTSAPPPIFRSNTSCRAGILLAMASTLDRLAYEAGQLLKIIGAVASVNGGPAATLRSVGWELTRGFRILDWRRSMYPRSCRSWTRSIRR